MRYLALACDYDGTLATHGHVESEVVAALRKLAASGRRLVLVTGRELPELLGIFPEIGLFERVVAENGALLYTPSSGRETPLAEPAGVRFITALEKRGVAPMSVGRVIVATWEPHQDAVLHAIHELGLELQVIFNKGAVMVLPAGVNKATGLAAALRELGVSRHNTVGIGDAENDHALLSTCECGVAVANALPALRERADWVTPGDHGRGVCELIERMLADDLASLAPRLGRHDLPLVTARKGGELRIPAYGANLLLAGPELPSLARALPVMLELIHAAGYQSCVLDPDGSLPAAPHEIVLGAVDSPPTIEELLKALSAPDRCVRANLAALPAEQRSDFIGKALAHMAALRGQVARPHWTVVHRAGSLTVWTKGRLDPAALPRAGMAWICADPAGQFGSLTDSINIALVREPLMLRELDPDSAQSAAESPLNDDEYWLWRQHARGQLLPVRLAGSKTHAGARHI